MPYAYGAIIKHEFDTDHLNIWLTFRHQMNQDNMPDLGLWSIEADDAPVGIVDSAWQDEFTLLLTSESWPEAPDRVTVEYKGPSPNLATTWGKDWEPWGPTLSIDLAGILPKYKVLNISRVLTLDSGDVSYTGVGFKGRLLHATCYGPASFGVGFDDGTTKGFAGTFAGPGWWYNIAYSIGCASASGQYQQAVVKSFDDDGFTLTWTKVGSPTGTGSVTLVLFE